MFEVESLQQAYSKWLAEYNWQWFCTLTFRDPPHPERAMKQFNYWIHRLNQRIFGRRYYKQHTGVYWILALEYHKSGVIHFHALVGDTTDLNTKFSRVEARNLWYQQAGIGRVDPIDDRLGAVTNYVSKYISKGGDIVVGPGLQNFAVQQQMGLAQRQ